MFLLSFTHFSCNDNWAYPFSTLEKAIAFLDTTQEVKNLNGDKPIIDDYSTTPLSPDNKTRYSMWSPDGDSWHYIIIECDIDPIEPN
jgi:hypothetical protein